MDILISWILDNKKWLFSGVGIVAITVIYKLFSGKSNEAVKTLNININDRPESIVKAIENTLIHQKSLIKILFIDDDTHFKIIKILNTSGWQSKITKDVNNLDSDIVINTHIFFVDINGVGKKLGFNDEGLGLANAIKMKYPEKKVVIYSSDENGNRFHNALRNVDDFLNKNAEPIEFQSLIEQFANDIINED